MVGGEALGNTEVKERRKKKKRHAEEKRMALAGMAYCPTTTSGPLINI